MKTINSFISFSIQCLIGGFLLLAVASSLMASSSTSLPDYEASTVPADMYRWPAPVVTAPYEPYEANVCEDDWATFEVRIIPEAGATYNWDFTDAAVLDNLGFNADGTIMTIDNVNNLPKDVDINIFVQVIGGSCGLAPIRVPLKLISKLDIDFVPADTSCIGRPVGITQLRSGRIARYEWDLGPNTEIASGDPEADLPFAIKWDAEGDFDYNLTLVDTFGCRTSADYDITIYEAPPTPVIRCDYISADSILFEWIANPNFTYEIDLRLFPQGAQLDTVDNTLLVSGFTAPPSGSSSILSIGAYGTNPRPCDFSSSQKFCRSCLPVETNTDKIDRFDFCLGDTGNLPVELIATVNADNVGTSDNPIGGTWKSTDGGVVDVAGQSFFDPTGLTAGSYTAVYEYFHPDDSCPWTSEVIFTIYERPETNLSFSPTSMMDEIEICADEELSIFYTAYPNTTPDISVEGGTFTQTKIANGEELFEFPNETLEYKIIVSYANQFPTCEPQIDTILVKVNAIEQLEGLSCGPLQTNAISMSWDPVSTATAYEVYVDGQFYDTVTDTDITIIDLDVNVFYDITVEALGFGCAAIAQTVPCGTGGCTRPSLIPNSLADTICHDILSGGYLLDAELISANPSVTGDFSYDSPFVDDGKLFYGMRNQESYAMDMLYEDDNGCTFTIPVDFVFIAQPTTSLLIDGNPAPSTYEHCWTDGSIQLNAFYDAFNTNGLDYVTDFPTGVNGTSVGLGMYSLSFDGPGTYIVSMAVQYYECLGDMETITFEITEPTEVPDVTCVPDYGGIMLVWNNTECAEAYEVIIDGESQTTSADTSYMIVTPDTDRAYDFTIIANATCLCPDAQYADSCTPLPCPSIDIVLTDVDTCYNPSIQPFDLDVEVTPSALLPAGGSGVWSGPIVNGAGRVDLSQASGPEVYSLDYTYTQGNCSQTVSTEVRLLSPPVLGDIETLAPACIDDELGTVIVNIEAGTGTPGYRYSVDAGSSFQDDNRFTDVAIGTVLVAIEDAAGCRVDGIAELEDMEDAFIEIEGEAIVIENNDAIYTIETNIDLLLIKNIIWRLDGNIVSEGADNVSYTVTNVTSSGTLTAEVLYDEDCTIMADKYFDINELQSIYIPNMVDFTGGSGAENAMWSLFVKGDRTFVSSVQIYDRWGNIVKDYENKAMDYFKELLIWDGNRGSVIADQGIYTYVIQLVIDGRVENRRGNITVLN